MKPENFSILIDDRTEYFDRTKFYTGNENGLTKIYELGNGTIMKEGAGEDGSWFATYKTRSGSCFSVYREYNHRGCIRKKWTAFRNGGAVVGIRYDFDESGKLQRQTNEEENFLFTPNDVIRYCLDQGINLYAQGKGYVERVSYPEEGKYLYIIHYVGKFKSQSGKFRIVLDGKTGEEKEVIPEY
ncbi:hypothetical protein [uncultured Chryseobacterium sp.]|uniref:hypothetical protein n=1 Tax=uncultured Chryseobacterium sp. TaxID=259322 RepID=UPI0025FECFA2|nr:hypothetical protein [uncultured Chryseobacterium sp.]